MQLPRHLLFPVILALLAAPLFAAPEPLFDGKTFSGWEGDTKSVWRIEDGCLQAGSLERKQEKNDFLATEKEFGDFELTLQWKLEGTQGFVNGGVQFRSKRVPNHHEVSGYQADLGAGYDGALYDESRRNKMLAQPAKEVLEKCRKPLGEWNDYRIRAEGPRIQLWLNGVQTVDYTEPDNTIPQRGLIAVQIHGAATSIVRYRNLKIEDLTKPQAAPPAKGPAARMTSAVPPRRALSAFENGTFTMEKNEVIVFTGSENMVLEQRSGWLEAGLAEQWRDQNPKFRHMGWEGDTVFRQNRMMEWGSWPMNLEAAGATTVVAWFGQVEVLDATKSAADFTQAYAVLLDQFSKHTPRVVMVGPPLFEKPSDPRVRDNTALNDRVREFSAAAAALAAKRGLVFVDLTTLPPTPSKALTRNGMHFNAHGQAVVGRAIAKALGAEKEASDPLRQAIVEKNRLWFDTWRCMNWAFAYGDRNTQPFAGGTAERPSFVDELKQYQPRLAHAEAVIHALATDGPRPEPMPPSPPRADPPALTPTEQMARFKLREGFAVNLFADESLDVIRPLQIRWDARGRLWVACTPAYPQLQPGEHGTDYILILEDADGDGRADKTTRFADRLTLPMGFEFAPQSVGGGLYVCESTELIHLRDENGDDHADGRETLLSGFGTGDTHQNANSLRWGPDGCLWFTQGYHIWSYVETPQGLAELNRSGVWRFNPRTLQLNSFLNESTAGLNCWGTAWDDYGQIFHGSGADTQIWHTTPALVPTLHPLSLPTGMAASRGKSMEPEFLGSSHLPDDLRGVLLKSTYYTSQVQLYRLRDAGSGFASEELGDLMSGENEFRPVETRVGPDGALYVCDWLNPVIGHYQASYRDPRRDRSHGRIWRVTAKDRALVNRPALGKLSAAELVEKLASPERWERDTAKFALYRMPATEALPAVQSAVEKASTRLLYELSGVLAAHETAQEGVVQRMLGAEDFRDRAWGAHLIGVWAEKLPNPLALLRQAMEDKHPRVRLEAVVACSWMPATLGAEAAKLATLALEQPGDAPINYALTQTIHALAPQWKQALHEGKLDFGDRFHALAKLLSTVGDLSVTKRVRELLATPNLTVAARESLLNVLIEYGTPQDADFAISQAPDSAAVMDALVAAAWRKPNADYGGGLAQLFSSPHAAAQISGCRIVAASGNAWGTGDRIERFLADANGDVRVRAAAMAAVARLKGRAALTQLLEFTESPDATLRGAAISAAAPLDPGAVAQRCAKLISQTNSPADMAVLLKPLFQQKQGPAHLIKAIAETKPAPEAAKRALQWMAETGLNHAELQAALQAAAGLTARRLEYSEATVKRLVAEATTHGNATQGAAVFAAAQSTCLACHKVGTNGGILGPDLSSIGRAMTPEAIVESVLWPKRQVKEGYLLTQVTTKSGEIFQGYKANETKESLTLKNIAGAADPPISKTNIATRTDAATLMPDGLMATMTEVQLRDLLRYLFELGR